MDTKRCVLKILKIKWNYGPNLVVIRIQITYLYYIPDTDVALEQTKRCISYTQLDMMAQMRDKMREDFVKMDLEYNKKEIWKC